MTDNLHIQAIAADGTATDVSVEAMKSYRATAPRSGGALEGYNIDLSKLPPGTTTLRVFISEFREP